MVSKSTLAGIGVVVVLAGGLGFTLLSAHAFGGGTHQIQVSFPTADGLVAGSDVLEAGSKIGTISDIQPTQDNAALVTVQIPDAHWPLHSGLTAAIRPKSLLGEKYVDLHDGDPKGVAYDENTVLHQSEKAVPVELDQFINSLDAPTRNAARVLLNDLGAGVAGRGQSLNEAIAAGKADLQNLAIFGTTLNNRSADLDKILVGLDGVLSKITTNDQLTQFSQLITNGQQTLNAIETQQTAFSRQFVDAQAALGELNTAVDGAVTSLQQTLDVAPHLLDVTNQESYWLTVLGKVANQPGVLPALDIGLLQGPTTTGGALETTLDSKGNVVKEPIFRVCLVDPGPGGSCMGDGTKTPGTDPVPAGYNLSGGADMNMLSGWLAS